MEAKPTEGKPPVIKVNPDSLRWAGNDPNGFPGIRTAYGNLRPLLEPATHSGCLVSGHAVYLVTAAMSIFNEVGENHDQIAKGLVRAAKSYEDTDETGRRQIDASIDMDDKDKGKH